MKNLRQHLLIFFALSLCVLCAWQWYGQTRQRTAMESLAQLLYEKSAAIQGYTNTIQTMDRQIAQMDARMTELKATAKTNDVAALSQTRELVRLQAANARLSDSVAEYKKALDSAETQLKETYAGIQKQNASVKELVAQRDDFVKKLNEAVQGRNEVVSQYNELVARFEKLLQNQAKSSP
jgi:chromosome segregation ATPase